MSHLKDRERERKLEKIRGRAKNGNGNGNGNGGGKGNGNGGATLKVPATWVGIALPRADWERILLAADNAGDAFDNDSSMRDAQGDEEDQQYIDQNTRDAATLESLATKLRQKGIK